MKSLLLLTLLGVSMLVGVPEEGVHDGQGLDMQLNSELVFPEMVRIYDYEGNLVKEFMMEDVANNDITINDHFLLNESDFAFSYMGDYYYLRSKEYQETVN